MRKVEHKISPQRMIKTPFTSTKQPSNYPDIWGSDFIRSRCIFSQAHRWYTRRINLREAWQGRLRQERSHFFVMDEVYLLGTVGYVARNQVRAILSGRSEIEGTWGQLLT